MGRMNTDRKTQAILARRRRPAAEQVLARPDVYGVPRLIFGIPIVEVVVVNGQRHEIPGAILFVESQELFGIKMFRLPLVYNVLETVCRRMAIFREMRFIIAASLQIHEARIPIAVLWLALRSPVRPNAELRIAKPFRALIVPQRIPVWLERAGRNGGQVQRTGLRSRGHERKVHQQKNGLDSSHDFIWPHGHSLSSSRAPVHPKPR
jgi:hypothetical protein